jgi:hypothetical protein
MQIIPSAVNRVGDRPNMTSRRGAMSKKEVGFPSLPPRESLACLALPACMHACMHACVNGNGRRSLDTGHRLTGLEKLSSKPEA